MSNAIKIATAITALNRNVNLVEVALRECHRHGIDLGTTRIGRMYTKKRGFMPAVFLVQEFVHVAAAIEASVAHYGCVAVHVQGGPTDGTISRYTVDTKPLIYTDKVPAVASAAIEYNGNTIYVKVQ